MASNGLARVADEEGHPLFFIDPGVHERLVESLAEPSLALQAATPAAES